MYPMGHVHPESPVRHQPPELHVYLLKHETENVCATGSLVPELSPYTINTSMYSEPS